jgi:hypothetical protein
MVRWPEAEGEAALPFGVPDQLVAQLPALDAVCGPLGDDTLTVP